MRKRRIGPAKFFTLLLLLYHTSAKTRSYKQLAEAIGRPNACRAVGMANHANPILIVIPCHRVICADGSPGGYAGGAEMKKALLRLEQAGGA